MNARAKRINAAMDAAKRRDKYQCQVCGKRKEDSYLIAGAHLLPRNVAFPWYRPDDKKWIISLCFSCHEDFGKHHSPEKLAMWLESKGLKKQAKQITDGINGRLTK